MSRTGFKVGILGMGRIACGFDEPANAQVRTHLKAVLTEPRLHLDAVADLDSVRAATELKRFDVSADVLTPSALLARKLDVICIASPDGTHLSYAEQVELARVVLLEKPVEGDSARRAALLAGLAGRNARLVIAHIRRFIPPLAGWVKSAQSGEFGRMVSAVIHYGRGLRHNAVHGLDLVAAIAGTQIVDVVECGAPVADFTTSDLTRTLGIRLRGREAESPVVLMGIDGRVQSVFSIDMRFERARIHIEDSDGVRATLSLPHSVGVAGFAPELRAAMSWSEAETPLMQAMWTHIADYLEGKAELFGADHDGLAVYDMVDAIDLHRCQIA